MKRSVGVAPEYLYKAKIFGSYEVELSKQFSFDTSD